jgi:hypothetical protein
MLIPEVFCLRQFCPVKQKRMRTKTIVDLLSLSVNLYMLSKDEDFLRKAAEVTAKGKQKAGELLDVFTGEDEDGEQFIQRILDNAGRMKQELEEKMDEVAVAVYSKMHIVHTNEIKKMAGELERLRTEVALAEARIVNLESQVK